MNNKSLQVTAAITIIGNEVLSGRTQDINVMSISKWLNTLGVQVKEVRIIPDIEYKIISTINELRKNFDYVFTTGGIGPTHDDITAESISKSFNLDYEFHKEAFKILENYYLPGEFNEGRQKMAKMPAGAELILNPTSAAPGFIIENVFCLPGVPSILQSMLGGLKHKISGGKTMITNSINLSTVESEIAKSLTEVQLNNKEVEIGSYPFFRAGKVGVSIVLRALEQVKIDFCKLQILKFVTEKEIKIIKNI